MTIPDVPDPNTDLADIRQKWLAFCSHDIGAADDFPFEFGVRGEGMAVTQPYPCICPTEDHRPVIAALVGEVETLRAEVARLEGACGHAGRLIGVVTEQRDQAETERDEAQALLRLAPHHQQQVETLEYELMQARAEVMWLTKQRDEARAELATYRRPGVPTYEQLLSSHAELLDERDEWARVVAEQGAENEAMRPVVEAAKAWSVANASAIFHGCVTGAALDLSDAVDQMAPSAPPSTPESDGQGEVAVTDAVEVPGGAEAHSCPWNNAGRYAANLPAWARVAFWRSVAQQYYAEQELHEGATT